MEEDEWDDALLSEIAALETRHLQTHSHQDQPQPPVTAAATSSSTSSTVAAWSCRSCTLQNEASRATCQVCATPRGQVHQAQSPARASSSTARKTVQARLSFDGTSAPVAVPPSQQRQQQVQDVGRSEPSPFAVREQPVRSSQQTITGLVLTSRRSGQVATSTATTREASSPPLQLPRHAAGEDSQAKTRYLDVVARSNFPQVDYEAAQSFVYPTNYSVRDYQLTIAEKALYHNTLVSLPTGLGKTLVAAVVMYNYYRWFPTGKIVFMAPTKPLVAQQIKACHEIMGIPLSDTAELQGNVPPTMRRVLWSSRRVFFCTPQSLQNDLRRGVCAAEKFVCIVVDEAHRATGNYAYCCVVQEIEAKTHFFRVLALSATPGAKFDVIQDVVTNLRISHIESRSADDPDVKKYTHARQEEVIVCRLGAQIMEVKVQFLKCLTPIIQRLLRGNIIQQSDPDKLSSWYVLQAREKFRKSPNYSSNRSAECDLALLVSLLHAKSLLTGHGLSSFREQITNWVEERKKGKMSWAKRELVQSSEFQSLELSLAVTDGANSSTKIGSHPKLVKLREVLLEHFQRHAAGKSSTRAIVFTQYRASVSEIVALLRPLAPLLNVQPFIGQGASGKSKENKGQTQKVQQEIVRRFRLGEFNVLVATCIAEEGLDIGEVDLIVSFDALTSPVRMIQRMGRTGRKRVGRVIILVTEGDEQKKLARSASAAKTVSRALTTFKSKFTYSKCPRMLPTGICPELRELEMKIPTFHASQVGGKAATGAVDPDLWQLSDAERAVSMMKYFPPNFATSSRNKLFPIVANWQHLLRPQPRSLVQKNVGSRVGYSARSLTLQGIVRKIHGFEEVLETDSDDEGDRSYDNGNNAGIASQLGLSNEIDAGKSPILGPEENYRRTSVSTNNVETDSEIGSPWRPITNSSGIDGESKCDQSFAGMDESVNSFDMHFSPQFVDSATQFASAVEEDNQHKYNSKRCQEDQVPTPAKKQKIGSTSQVTPQAVYLPTLAGDAIVEGKQQADRFPNGIGGQRSSLENIDNEERSQHMTATLSLTLTSESPRPLTSSCKTICQQVPAQASDTTESTQQFPVAPRQRSIRQLQFNEDEDDDQLGRTQSILERAVPAVEGGQAEPLLEKYEARQVEEVDSPAFSFALLPPATDDTNAVGETNDGSEDDDQAEEEPSAFSFALLPALNGNTEAIPRKPSMSPKLAGVAPQEGGSQPVEDGTDGDEVDEANELKPAVKDTVVGITGTSVGIVDLTEKEDIHGSVRHEEKAKVSKPILPSSPRAAGSGGATQRPVQSQQKETEPEQEDEGCCSICLASESYDDDPIVFCDGCNVAVHQFCYGMRVLPRDNWFCEVCTEVRAGGSAGKSSQPRCELCPLRGGAFKRSNCGQWVHVQCFLWIPEFQVEQGDGDMLVLGSLDRLDQDRKTLDCSLCHSKQGHGIIQCAHKRCLAAFHVGCAASAHYRMDQLDPPDGHDTESGTLFLAYCPLHRNSTVPVAFPEQQKTSPAAKARSPNPPLPTPAKKPSSPSHLLTSPSSTDAKKKFKTFRRLKRKYDASQSQMFSQLGAKGSPASTSPWQKRIKRSKRRRDTARALAAAYIDDAADVRGGTRDDDDDEDDYGDDYKDAADDSFINDSSQLLYSQSVVFPEDAGNNSAKKKKRKKSSPNMRAIYARSLFESQSSPLLLRRGRQLGALPSNGIIRACLEELHNGSNEVDTPSPRPRSRSRPPETADHVVATTPSALSAPLSASGTVTESDGDDSATEAEPSPSFNLLGAGQCLGTIHETSQNSVMNEDVNNVVAADSEMAPPSFSLLGASKPLANLSSTKSVGPGARTPTTAQPSTRAQDTGDYDLQKKIEANRLKALRKLEERRKAKLQRTQAQIPPPQQQTTSLDSDQKATTSHEVNDRGFTSAAELIKDTTKDEVDAPSFSLLGSKLMSPTRGVRVSTVDLTSPKLAKASPIQEDRSPKWIIFVSSSFASSSSFPAFLSAKRAECAVVIDDSLEADTLLSVRTAVLFLTGQQLLELALASPAQDVVKNGRVGTLLAMHKKIIVAVLHDGGDPPEVLRLRQIPNATVVVQPRLDSLCAQLHRLAHQELVEGFELPSPSLCRPDFSGGVVRALDAEFSSRLTFFRTIPPLSLGSALSLSFRFKNFAAGQVPVRKFNEMHWRRMLPWISESTAEEIRKHIHQNMQRS